MTTITDGDNDEERQFATTEEAVQTNVELEFGVLVERFHILALGWCIWYRDDINHAMKACNIIHNMVVEAKRDSYSCIMCCLGMYRNTQAIFGTQFAWQSRRSLQQMTGTPLTDSMSFGRVMQREARLTRSLDLLCVKVRPHCPYFSIAPTIKDDASDIQWSNVWGPKSLSLVMQALFLYFALFHSVPFTSKPSISVEGSSSADSVSATVGTVSLISWQLPKEIN